MAKINVCDGCGVPLMVSGGLNWEANGVITLASSLRNRMVFFESDTIEQLFTGIEELIGISIKHVIIESRARETKRYIERAFPPELRKAVERMGKENSDRGSALPPEERETLLATIKAITDSVIDISRVYGYGDQRAGDLWESGGEYPWRTQVIRNPYSLLFISADNLGSVEACEGASMRVGYEEIGENEYKVEVYPGEHPVGLRERLQRKHYDFKPGDIKYERCPICGIPKEVAFRAWDLDEGTIIDRDTGRRMAIFGPSALDSIFEDLESELGEAIPETIIEAQRRYIKSAWGGDQWNIAGSTFQHMIALRGLGFLKTFEGDKTHLSLSIENSCLHLLMVGTMQALVEQVYSLENSTCQWELAKDGDLTITVQVK
jgi:hypothetical protein